MKRSVLILGLLVALAACGRADDNNLAAIDNELLANGADPALTSALEDQILADPNLVQQAHPNAVRPPETPVQAQYPPREQGAAGRAEVRSAAATATGAAAPCGAAFEHGLGWARRLPPEWPIYPGARVTEAAGTEAERCALRVVTFRTGDAHDRVLAYYRGVASRAGFSAEQQRRGADHVLGGVNERTDGAFYLIVTPQDRGSEVALIVNNGS